MLSKNFQPVLREESLSVRVANMIEQMIRDGELKIGEKMPPERILCERFQVSRTVIREATSYLMAKGLLVSQAGSGTYVRNVESTDVANYLELHMSLQDSPAGIDQFIEIRRLLEIQIAKIAAQRADQNDIEAIEENLRELKTLLNSPDEFAKKDLEFHLLLARSTKNPLFEILLKPLINNLLEVIHLALVYEKAGEEAIHFHGRIFEEIKNKRADGAALEMGNHLNQSRHAVLAALEKMKKTSNEGSNPK
jgi:GntR family transcriptional repressor for pyruvate dehydrogenase complex